MSDGLLSNELVQTAFDEVNVLPDQNIGDARQRQLMDILDSDATLRLVCAVKVPDGSAATGGVCAAHVYPVHPLSSMDAQLVSLGSLLDAQGENPLLKQLITARSEQWLDPVEFIAEYCVRPLLTAFRTLIDHYGLGLCDLSEDGVVFELSRRGRLTGRIVITDVSAVRPVENMVSLETQDLPAVLRSLMDALADAVRNTLARSGDYRGREIRMKFRRTLAEELRFLQPATAELLRSDHKQGTVVHSVLQEQHDVLTTVLRRVEEAALPRRKDPALPMPTVVIDLDLCALVPTVRTIRAVQEVSHPRPGAPQGIAEMADPASLTVLPAYPEKNWANFLELIGLTKRYPAVDWAEVHAEFHRAVHRPWSTLASDTLTPGLVRFVRDVEDAGGLVVFNTARRERVRTYTSSVLAQHGLGHVQILMQPDERPCSMAELKIRNLATLADRNVVAVFDDLLENRQLATKLLPESLMIAVRVPGFAGETAEGQAPADGAQVIATFETVPRNKILAADRQGSALSHTHSITELPVSELATRLPARNYEVHMSQEQSSALVDRLTAEADSAAIRTATLAFKQLHATLPDFDTEQERTVALLHHVFLRKQFHRGARATYTPEMAAQDMLPVVRRGEPIRIAFPGLPVKQSQSALKAAGPLPDLAELGLFIRLRELAKTIQAIYEPGIRITALTDGSHFRPRPESLVGPYVRKLHHYLDLVDGSEFLELMDIDEAVSCRGSAGISVTRAKLIRDYQQAYYQALGGLDITRNPLGVLATVARTDPTPSLARGAGALEFAGIFRSIVHAVPVSLPQGKDQLIWSRQLYADIYSVDDPHCPADIRAGRQDVLQRAWHDTIRYLSASLADRELGYESLFGHDVRLTVSMPSPGRIGFTGLGGSALLPWHGTAVVDQHGTLSTDFAIWLYDQGFVPVYSPLLGRSQPWFMAPVASTRVNAHGAELTAEAFVAIHLRRK